MSSKGKLIERFKRQPKDFTWDELVRLFGIFGFTVDNRGRTSGSRMLFVMDKYEIEIHKPHPSKVVKAYAVKKVLSFLVAKGFIRMEE